MQIELAIGEPEESISIRALKTRFYLTNIIRQKELKREFKGQRKAYNPIAIVLNPPKFVDTHNPMHVDVYYVVYTKKFYVKVTHGRSMHGPHRMELLFQSETGKHRLGCALGRFFFLKELELRKQLRANIIGKKYFATEETEDEVVVLNAKSAADIIRL